MIFFALAENSIQLVPDGTVFLHIVLILMMIFVLNRTLFKPINRILEERDKRTRGGSSEAQDTLTRVEEKLSLYERSLRQAREEGYRLLENVRTKELQDRQAQVVKMREDLTQALAAEKKSVAGQTEASRIELAQDAKRIASEIGLHILGRPIGESGTTEIGLRS